MTAGFELTARFAPNPAAMRSFLESPDGPLERRLREVAEVVRVHAEAHAPVETAASAAEHNRTPGRLAASIEVQRDGLGFLVGSTLPFARRLEFNPHVGGFLRAALAAAVGADAMRRPA